MRRTFFADETVVSVVRVVGVAGHGTAAVSYDSDVEFCVLLLDIILLDMELIYVSIRYVWVGYERTYRGIHDQIGRNDLSCRDQ